MQLNPEGMQRFHAHLQNALRHPCAICGSGNWQFDDTIFELRQFAGGGITANGQIKPVVSITCNGCGNIIFMNALTTGVIQVSQQDGLAQDAPADVPQENITEEQASTIAHSA